MLVHGQDIRRPLGLAHELDPDRGRAALDFVVTAKAQSGIVPRGLLDGLRLDAVDLGWTHGEGPDVRGPAEAILLVATGRAVALADLEGAGVEVLAGRLVSRG